MSAIIQISYHKGYQISSKQQLYRDKKYFSIYVMKSYSLKSRKIGFIISQTNMDQDH